MKDKDCQLNNILEGSLPSDKLPVQNNIIGVLGNSR